MADPLYQLLVPYFDTPSPRPPPSSQDPVTAKYLSRLSTLPLNALTSTEPESLAQSSQSTLRSLQSLSAKSNAAIVTSSDHLFSLTIKLPFIAAEARKLQDGIPKLDEQAVAFSTKYSRSAKNDTLDRRKKALLMARNVDRVSDILDLPTLLSSAISSSTAQGASSTTNYASALDLYSHIKRLHLLYQDSALVSSIYKQTEEAMQEMTSSLIASLRVQNIKLAAAMRTIGWLRRVAPDLDSMANQQGGAANREGALGALFLVCRLATLVSMLSALDPLRSLADQESAIRHREKGADTKSNNYWSGQQTEQYLKRYIEIFREQSFAMVSMYRSIFPAAPDNVADDLGPKFQSLGFKSTLPSIGSVTAMKDDPLLPLPSALSTFPLHIVDLLTSTLKQYLPNVRDKSSRESLLTQVLYCAGSLGRLGGDFSLIIASLADDGKDEMSEEEDAQAEGSTGDEEWVEVMRKHRELAGRLELLASGVGGSGKSLPSRSPISPTIA